MDILKCFSQILNKYYKNEHFKDYLRIRGRYNLNLEQYYDNNQYVNLDEIPVLEDWLRLLNCIDMKPYEIIEAQYTEFQNDKLKAEVYDLK